MTNRILFLLSHIFNKKNKYLSFIQSFPLGNVSEKKIIKREQDQSYKYYHDSLGYNYRMDRINVAVFDVNLKHLNKLTEQWREVNALYNEAL